MYLTVLWFIDIYDKDTEDGVVMNLTIPGLNTVKTRLIVPGCIAFPRNIVRFLGSLNESNWIKIWKLNLYQTFLNLSFSPHSLVIIFLVLNNFNSVFSFFFTLACDLVRISTVRQRTGEDEVAVNELWAMRFKDKILWIYNHQNKHCI